MLFSPFGCIYVPTHLPLSHPFCSHWTNLPRTLLEVTSQIFDTYNYAIAFKAAWQVMQTLEVWADTKSCWELFNLVCVCMCVCVCVCVCDCVCVCVHVYQHSSSFTSWRSSLVGYTGTPPPLVTYQGRCCVSIVRIVNEITRGNVKKWEVSIRTMSG